MVELKALGVTARRFAENQTIDVKNIREAQHLSQSEFALLYQLELDTLQNWEQGRYAPDNSSTVLLKVIQRRPDAVLDALTEEPQATESNI
jgi:DNA-binding transcriptional regulator YiaG